MFTLSFFPRVHGHVTPPTLRPNKSADLGGVWFLQDFILQHYSEDGNSYEDEIADLMDLRQVA